MIKVLPDSVANQIAAGEVIQRPASVIKELVENAVDAGSSSIDIIVKDAGSTLIQVIDNGSGMSDTDARLAFERHATSKITTANDLLQLYTFGFRGEALASIASIAEVELKTRRAEDETGTRVCISASQVTSQETISCDAGSSFAIKNIFFNVPARRKFLKSENVELKHIISEFQRIALCNPNVEFSLNSNGTVIYQLPKGNLRQRIAGIFGKNMSNNLLPVNVETSIAKIEGFISKPELTRKTTGDQFFFANGRFFKSAYFQKAVVNAYAQLIPYGTFPVFFLYVNVNPENIDVNIHPTKVEIKFSEEQTIWQIINVAVRESLGKFALAPQIDFSLQQEVEIPVIRSDTQFNAPKIEIDPTYNPFDNEETTHSYKAEKIDKNWQKLYPNNEEIFELEPSQEQGVPLFEEPIVNTEKFIQIRNQYIATNTKSGLMIIDQKRAHLRVLFEQFLKDLDSPSQCIQQEMFPSAIELNAADFMTISNRIDDLQKLGFDIRIFGKSSIVVQGLPQSVENNDPKNIIRNIIDDLNDENSTIDQKSKTRLALALAKASAISNKTLTAAEMNTLVGKLLICQNPNICPEGKPTLTIITFDELSKRFLK